MRIRLLFLVLGASGILCKDGLKARKILPSELDLPDFSDIPLKSKLMRLLKTECGDVLYSVQIIGGYIKKCPAFAVRGYSSVTVGNSQNGFDAFFNLCTTDTEPPKATSIFFIRAYDTITVTNIQSD
jgi:hypothetical protein